ncbi:WW domain-containing oxidoreductase [Cytospora mali]|uniref:WW domain-containing oxidoreductase n=1 Tax=Cytospora mali TaxID=578113 RepID=A0A194VDG8_CYTMA|nr:WW domain-containing oxidoreductase [Valsa mali var. pyri (nom. inval.)]
MSTLSFLYSQLCVEPKAPQHDFTGQTIVITGGNAGLGFEAARHLIRLNASRIILGVRSISRGAEAKQSLLAGEPSSPCHIELLSLDLESYASVQAFTASVSALDRVDAVLLNAGKVTQDFYLVEGNESTLTVNVTSTFLLLITLLPCLRLSAARWDIIPRVSIVSSDRHVESNLPEWREKDTFAVLNDPEKADMNKRRVHQFLNPNISHKSAYHVSKLLQILLTKAIAERLAQAERLESDKPGPTVIINTLTPGMCRSGLSRNLHGWFGAQIAVMTRLLARTTEVGGRTLVSAIVQGYESHGKYMNDGEVQE